MRTGGLAHLFRMWASHALRSHGERYATRVRNWADAIDPTAPTHVEPPREWQPRLWERDHDARTEQEERRP